MQENRFVEYYCCHNKNFVSDKKNYSVEDLVLSAKIFFQARNYFMRRKNRLVVSTK